MREMKIADHLGGLPEPIDVPKLKKLWTGFSERLSQEEMMLAKNELQSIETIAEIGSIAVLALEDILGEPPKPFDPEERKAETEAGVQFILDHPAAPLSAQHDAWIARNRERMQLDDPRLVPYDQLPFGMQLKARLWRHICHAIIG